MIFPVVCLVPVWGFLCFVFLEFHSRREHGEAPRLEIGKLTVEDEIHKSIHIDESSGENTVAPLNEILVLNDAKTRRNVIMEVLYENPADYIHQLQTASVNDDTEVVHYAVTALIELQKEYDLKFQELERRRKEKPDDIGLDREYLELMDRYLGSGLIAKNSRALYLKQYGEALSRELKRGERFSSCLRMAEIHMELKEYGEAERMLCHVVTAWPEREKGYLKLMECYAAQRNRDGIEDVLLTIREKDVYLSPEGRTMVRFWSNSAAE